MLSITSEINIKMRSDFTLTRMVIIKTWTITSVGQEAEKWEPSIHSRWKGAMVQLLWKSLVFPQKVRIIWHSNSTPTFRVIPQYTRDFVSGNPHPGYHNPRMFESLYNQPSGSMKWKLQIWRANSTANRMKIYSHKTCTSIFMAVSFRVAKGYKQYPSINERINKITKNSPTNFWSLNL